MEHSNNRGAVAIEARRVASGDAGLDRILGGGIFRGAVTILQGMPGAGKTTLANQMAFENSRRGGRTVYITLLSESHGRMTASLTPMRFFDDAEIGQTIHYVSGYSILMEEGARALLHLIGSEARDREANLVVLDGLFVLGDAGLTESEYRRFVNDLALQAELMGCTVLLLTNGRRASDSPEFTMVDGWLELGWQVAGHRACRFIEAHKLRGSGFLAGRHSLRISTAGVEVFPRLESYLGHRPRVPTADARVSTGVDAIDAMLGGGLPAFSNTLVWGPTGIGKTTVGLHFLSMCSPDAPGLLFGFYESPEECVHGARRRGIDLESRIADGSLQVVWHPPTEHDLDMLGHALLDNVRTRGVRRLLIDGIDAFEKVALEPGRLHRYLTALTYELRSAGCTSMFTSEIAGLFDEQPLVLAGDRSAIGQNILLMRYAQQGERLTRSLSWLKVRESAFDTRAHAFEIGAGGLRLQAPLDPRSTPAACMATGTAGA
ncbi:RAD55 family ATPase [Cognatilysobacter segetis]|uniref:RAD55 family ATPase n=1 Tax=Cognatilysobacter segetis TaxID=2492394 RepID=UPI00105FC777|nr:ATPase domain-containing protein [Lysobacter segetis]